MDTQLKEERETMTESEARFEDIARKLATLEAESERSMERCTAGKKVIERNISSVCSYHILIILMRR